MKFGIIPWDFMLLSEERQEALIPSSKFKKNPQKAIQEICAYVRNIIPGAELSRIAHEFKIDTWIVILLSNYVTTKKQLTWALRRNSFLNEVQTHKWVLEIQDIIENDFGDFDGFDIWLTHIIVEKWNHRQRLRQEETQKERIKEEKEKEERNNANYTLLCEHFWLPDNKDSRKKLWENTIRYSWMAEEVIEYCTANGIFKLWENWWNYNTKQKFLIWYAEREGHPTDPDRIDLISVVLPI